MRRFLPPLVLFSLLAALAGFAWLTHHPDTPWLEEAEDWPLVGSLAAGFREAYLGPEPAPARHEQAAEEPTVLIIEDGVARPADTPPRDSSALDAMVAAAEQRARRVAEEHAARREAARRQAASGAGSRAASASEGSTAGSGPSLVLELHHPVVEPPAPTYSDEEVLAYRWLMPGTVLTDGPASQEGALRLGRLSRVPVVERRGGSFQVVFDGRRRWVEEAAAAPPRPDRSARPRRFMPLLPNDPVRLRHARKILDLDGPVGSLGPYRLFTDSSDRSLLAMMDGAASHVESAYLARYGRQAGGKARQAVVLFEDQDDYRAYAEGDGGSPGVSGQRGHAAKSIVAFYAGVDSERGVTNSLLHELTHLLNRRALAPQLAPWLEEGLATDLGLFHLELATPPSEGPVGRTDDEAVYLRLLRRAMDQRRLPPLADLMTRDTAAFYTPSDVEIWVLYAESAYFIRYLLDGEGGRRAAAFRAFLAAVARAQADPEGADLMRILDEPLAELESGFRVWLAGEEAELQALPL